MKKLLLCNSKLVWTKDSEIIHRAAITFLVYQLKANVEEGYDSDILEIIPKLVTNYQNDL